MKNYKNKLKVYKNILMNFQRTNQVMKHPV